MGDVGQGRAAAHHGELVQGLFRGPAGDLHRALVTMPCDLFGAEAVFHPGGPLRVEPTSKRRALEAAAATLTALGAAPTGRLELTSNIPTGWGLGSSTADVVAAIRAVADAHGASLPSLELARLAVGAEVASDSTMFSDRVVLWAQREALVIEDLGWSYPPIEVIGCSTGTVIGTLQLPPPAYTDWEKQAFSVILATLRRGIRIQDPVLVGRAATASARINQRYVPKRSFDDLERLVTEVGGLGLQVAHSGTVVGLLLDPDDQRIDAKRRAMRRALVRLGLRPVWRFTVGTDTALVRVVGP